MSTHIHRRTITLLAISFLVSICAYGFYIRKETDPSRVYEKKVVGTWICTETEGLKVELTYNADKSFEGNVYYENPPEHFMFTGTWSIENEVLIEDYLESTDPNLETPWQSRDKIISCSKEELVVKSSDGKLHIHKRKH